MEDVLRRLGSLEKDVSAIKAGAGAITAVIPHLAAKADVAQVPHLAINTDGASVRTHLRDAKTSIIRWTMGTAIAVTALAFIVAKFVH